MFTNIVRSKTKPQPPRIRAITFLQALKIALEQKNRTGAEGPFCFYHKTPYDWGLRVPTIYLGKGKFIHAEWWIFVEGDFDAK